MGVCTDISKCEAELREAINGEKVLTPEEARAFATQLYARYTGLTIFAAAARISPKTVGEVFAELK